MLDDFEFSSGKTTNENCEHSEGQSDAIEDQFAYFRFEIDIVLIDAEGNETGECYTENVDLAKEGYEIFCYLAKGLNVKGVKEAYCLFRRFMIEGDEEDHAAFHASDSDGKLEILRAFLLGAMGLLPGERGPWSEDYEFNGGKQWEPSIEEDSENQNDFD